MKTLFVYLFVSITLFAQERVLLHIGSNGHQEVIPLKESERVGEVIARREKDSSVDGTLNTMVMTDTLKYFTGEASLTTSFSFSHQSVALQYYIPGAGGFVKELWWRNSNTNGVLHKATIRAWNVDQRVRNLGATRPMGYYKDPTDNDGLITPFKPLTGDKWFYKTGSSPDTLKYGFDPLGTEAQWLKGGAQVSLNRNSWQGITLSSLGDTMKIFQNVPFGFTIQNDTKIMDYSGGSDTSMTILSTPTLSSPFHSFKFSETSPIDAVGWYIRSEYEWGMYVLVEYTTDREPKIIPGSYLTTLKTTPRTISAVITDDNPGGGPSGIASAWLFSKKGVLAAYDSTVMTANGSMYSGTASAGAISDTIYWYITATDVNGNRARSTTQSYKIFEKKRHSLLVYNNAQYALGNTGVNYIYANYSTNFDRWSVPGDGTEELLSALKRYYSVYVVDGSYPRANVMPILQQWMLAYIGPYKKQLLISSQDYGAMIQPSGKDTVFPAGSFEREYLGLASIGPQDVGPVNKPYQIILVDRKNQYPIPFYKLWKYMSDSAVTLWHYPTFELAFSGYPDGITPDENTSVVFHNRDSTVVHGIMKLADSFSTMFIGFDAGALDFRSDTSKSPQNDPRYAWIADIPNLSIAQLFLYPGVSEYPPPEPLGVTQAVVPYIFDLQQNYPNPFNPSTTINYEVASRGNVSIDIYNTLGQSVGTLVNEVKEPGRYTASFNGRGLSSGLYLYEMRAGSFVSVKKMMLLK
ncbi:MAG: T9SS type A sorting domain-containing protein [Bacteroidota bacterium]